MLQIQSSSNDDGDDSVGYLFFLRANLAQKPITRWARVEKKNKVHVNKKIYIIWIIKKSMKIYLLFRNKKSKIYIYKEYSNYFRDWKNNDNIKYDNK